MLINVLDGDPEWSATRRFTIACSLRWNGSAFRLRFRGNQSNHVSHHLRIKPAHSIRPYREIRGMKRVGLNKLKHLSVNDRPLRLHQVKHKRWPVHIVGMKEANCRIVPIGDDLYPDLAFKHSIGVIQNCIDRMRGISIRADFVSSRRARPHLMC